MKRIFSSDRLVSNSDGIDFVLTKMFINCFLELGRKKVEFLCQGRIWDGEV